MAGAELFDARLFGLHASEATLMDPQQRMILQCSAELVLSNAGSGSLTGEWVVCKKLACSTACPDLG